LSEPAKPARFITRADTVALIASSAFFMELLDATIIVPAIPQMAETFGTHPVALSTGISAYLLTVAIFIPASAWLTERFGARLVFSVAIAVFTVASVLCGMSETMTEFTLARILQGVGGAMMSPVGRLEVLRRTDKPQLLRAIAFLTWPGLAAFAVGPPLGGFLATYASWPWIFYINVPVGIMGITLVLIHFEKGTTAARRPFDYFGFLVAGGSLACLLYGFERLGHPHEWKQAVAFIGTGLALGWLALRHARRHPSPLLTLEPFKIRTFTIGNIHGGTLFRMQVGAIAFALPVMLQVGLGYSAFHAGLLIFVFLMGDLSSKSYANRLLRRFGFKNVLVYDSLLIALSTLTIIAVTADTPLWLLLPILFAAGSIRSIHFSALNSLNFADVPQQQMNVASTLTSMTQQVTMAAGVSLAAVTLNLSLMLRGAEGDALSLFDFRVTLAISAVLALIIMVVYIRMPSDAGAHVTGHKRE
jgi:EmrB/QacA subfamily drug resistance transporter